MQKLLTTALAAATVLVAGCQQSEDRQPIANAPEPEAPAPRLPTVEQPMDRTGLLEAVAAATSAAALGHPDGDAQRKLDGKTFEVRIRFGCAAPSQGGGTAGPFGVSFDGDSRTLKVRAAPDLTMDNPNVAQLAGAGVEAVEGFWMRRPWLLSDGCPIAVAAPVTTDEVPPSGQRIGLAEFFGATDSRTGRRKDRAYEATSILPAGEQPSREGYNLVLSGRLKMRESGSVVTCRIAGRDVAPECIVSAAFDHVWIEHPQSRAVIAEWTS